MANVTNPPITDSTGQNIVTELEAIKNKISQGGGSGGSGTDDYSDLNNKPQIAGVTLVGNKTLSDLGIQSELQFDNVPTRNSNNPVKSGGVYSALNTAVSTEMSARQAADTALQNAINAITEVTAAEAEADWNAVFGNS